MLNWLDSRTGMVTLTRDFLTEDVPGGASYWYAFGSATVFAMILQIATGIFLTFYYSPSAATAIIRPRRLVRAWSLLRAWTSAVASASDSIDTA